MWVKIIVLIFIAIILFSLGSALFYLVKDKGESTKVVKALSIRIGVSVSLFILLLLAFYMGWIKPHGL